MSSKFKKNHTPWNKGLKLKDNPEFEDYLKNMSKAQKERRDDRGGWTISEEGRKNISEAIKKKWLDPEFREKQKNRKLTEETKDKIRKGNKKWREENPDKLVEISKKLSISQQRNWSDPEFREKRLNPEYRRNLSESAKKQWSDPKIRKKMLKGILKAWQNEDRVKRVSTFMENQGTGVAYLKGWHNSPKAGKIMYKSSWELYTFLMLDEDETVLNYVSEPCIITYDFEGRKYSYTIDLKIEFGNLEVLFVEIKPQYQLKDLKNKAKIKAAKKLYGDEFQVWTEKEVPGFNTCYWELTEQAKDND